MAEPCRICTASSFYARERVTKRLAWSVIQERGLQREQVVPLDRKDQSDLPSGDVQPIQSHKLRIAEHYRGKQQLRPDHYRQRYRPVGSIWPKGSILTTSNWARVLDPRPVASDGPCNFDGLR